MDERFDILIKVDRLVQAYRSGLLGGEKMPEDENPHLEKNSAENYMYFTLPMALNYQRNSYALWECANRMYADENARRVFDAGEVCAMPETLLRKYLTDYKVALQPNKQPVIWKRICESIEDKLNGDIRNLFSINGFSVNAIKAFIQNNKRDFPYLGGTKICNYWLYVLEQRTDLKFIDRHNISVAPDTHVIQASQKLGVISEVESRFSNVQAVLAERWRAILDGTGLDPIDIHTPMWLWSRSRFALDVGDTEGA